MIDLLERARESEVIHEALDVVEAGDGRYVMVEGPAGIGKTFLAADVSLVEVAAFLESERG